jgi:hypothetical protein
MKLLLDENIPRALRRDFAGHNAITVGQAGWNGIRNGALLTLAEQQFDAFLTMDLSLPFQQNVNRFNLIIIVLHAQDNTIATLRPLVPKSSMRSPVVCRAKSFTSRLDRTPAPLIIAASSDADSRATIHSQYVRCAPPEAADRVHAVRAGGVSGS